MDPLHRHRRTHILLPSSRAESSWMAAARKAGEPSRTRATVMAGTRTGGSWEHIREHRLAGGDARVELRLGETGGRVDESRARVSQVGGECLAAARWRRGRREGGWESCSRLAGRRGAAARRRRGRRGALGSGGASRGGEEQATRHSDAIHVRKKIMPGEKENKERK